MGISTRVIGIDAENIDFDKLNCACELLKNGDVVSFPTETVYGLGANALDENAIKKIYEIKKRPSDNPLIVHVSSKQEVYGLVEEVSDKARKLMDFFWPGPLTIVFKKKEIVPNITSGGLSSVAIRMPLNKIALELIKNCGFPIAAPSANSFGKPSPTLAKHVLSDFDWRLKLIIDGGQTDIGIESTVIDLTGKEAILLRPGGVSLEDIEKVIGKIKVHPVIKGGKLKGFVVGSPGMKYKHYSPNAPIILVSGDKNRVKKKINELVEGFKKENKKIGVISFEDDCFYDVYSLKFIGSDFSDIARNLFKSFREFDCEGVDLIISEGIGDSGLGLGIMNRLKKASVEIINV